MSTGTALALIVAVTAVPVGALVGYVIVLGSELREAQAHIYDLWQEVFDEEGDPDGGEDAEDQSPANVIAIGARRP